MDSAINVAHSKCETNGEQLDGHHSREMKDLMDEHSRRLEEIAGARDAAAEETTRITEERDAIKVESDANAPTHQGSASSTREDGSGAEGE